MKTNPPTAPGLPGVASRWTVPLAAGVLVVAVLAAYGNSLAGPFVYDDLPAIPGNPTIRHLWPLSDVLLPQAAGGLTVSGRPVLNLSLALNYAISGEAVWSYHAFNLLVHVGAALLLFGLVRRTLERWSELTTTRLPARGTEKRVGVNSLHLAFAIAALWALHPLQTQAVTYTVQRAESLMGFFYLLTLYAFVRATDCHPLVDKQIGRDRIVWLGVSVIACLGGMATKEVMATAPLLVVLYDRTFVAGSFGAAWRKRRRYYTALAATWLLIGALVLSTGGNRGGTVGLGVGVPLWAYPLTQFQAIARYLRLSGWPDPLVFEYGTFWVERAGDILPFAVLVVPLVAGTVLALSRKPVLGFAGAWFFGILAPSSLAPGTIQMIVEHRMYLPLAAVSATIVLTLHGWVGRRALPVLAVVVAAFAILAGVRNRDYRSHLVLWTKTVAQRPDNPRARVGLAEAYTELGQLDQAIAHYTEATRLLPDEANYHYNLALILAQTNRLDEAILRYQHALRLVPTEARTHNNLAIALVRVGRLEAALPHYAEAERLAPADPQFPYNHGIALGRLGRDTEAIARFEAALQLDPNLADAHFNLASGLARLGRYAEARRELETVLRLKPADAEAQRHLAQVRTLLGR